MGFRAGYLLVIGGSGHVRGGEESRESPVHWSNAERALSANCPAPEMLTAKWGGGRGGPFRTVRGVVGFASHTQKSSGTPWINLQEIDHFVAFAELPWQTIRLGYLEPALFLAQFMMM